MGYCNEFDRVHWEGISQSKRNEIDRMIFGALEKTIKSIKKQQENQGDKCDIVVPLNKKERLLDYLTLNAKLISKIERPYFCSTMRIETEMVEVYQFLNSEVNVRYGISYKYPNVITQINSKNKKIEQDIKKELEELAN